MDEHEQPPAETEHTDAGWTYSPDRVAAPQQNPSGSAAPQVPTGLHEPAAPEPAPASDATLTWSASEFIAHEKNGGWYVLAAVGAVVVGVVVYLVTRDVFSTAVVVLLGVLFSVAAARQPRTVEYSLSPRGVTSGQHFYPYDTFKSFALAHDQAIASITLQPLKRFGMPLTMYMPPEEQDRIVTEISSKLPMQHGEVDRVDRMMHRIRF